MFILQEYGVIGLFEQCPKALLTLPNSEFSLLALGDVPPDAAITDKMSFFIKYRHSRDRHITLSTVRGWSCELEIPERQMGIERLPVSAPSLLIWLQMGHLPARFANFRSGCGRIGKALSKLLANETM